MCETYGLAKEGARHHGYTGQRGYHPLLAIAAGTGDVLMSRLREGQFVSVSAGEDHACGMREDGSVECWGNNWNGKATTPEGRFSSISAGEYHTCGVREDGTVECWGQKATPPEGRFLSVSAGLFYTCGVGEDGSVNCWGQNQHGEADDARGSVRLRQRRGHVPFTKSYLRRAGQWLHRLLGFQ